MPKVAEKAATARRRLNKLFSDEPIAYTEQSLFYSNLKGKFVYFKLAEFGFLEFYDDGKSSNFSKETFYPFMDVIGQFGINLENNFAFQNLEKEIKLRKNAQNSLKSNEEKYSRIIDNIELGLMEVDTEEIIQYANKPFLDLTGYRLEELIGKEA